MILSRWSMRRTRADVLAYRNHRAPQPPSKQRLMRWLRNLPRPSCMTVATLLLTATAAYWFIADHAAWIVVRQFDGALPAGSC